MRNGLILLLLLCAVPAAHLFGMGTGVGLCAVITKADNASSLSIGPSITFDFPLGDGALADSSALRGGAEPIGTAPPDSVSTPRCAGSALPGAVLSVELYSTVFIGSTAGLNLRLFYAPPLRVWRPRIGAGTGVSVNDRIIYADSLDGFAVPPMVTWNVVATVEPLRFTFRGGGVSFLGIDVFTNLNGEAREFGSTVTLFRFISGNGDGNK
jgi:hypothetical protein